MPSLTSFNIIASLFWPIPLFLIREFILEYWFLFAMGGGTQGGYGDALFFIYM